MEHVYASIDIGSDSIKVVVCELYQNHLNLLAATCTPSSGIKKGLIVEPEKAKDSIVRALKETEAMLGIRIKKVIATVPCHRALYKIIKGECKIEGDLISGKDVINSYKDGIKKNLNINEEFVNIIPIDFNINGKTVIKDPKNFPGDTLSGRAMMITTPKKNVYSVATIIESIGVELADISVGSVCDINTFKSKELDENISAIINIGSDITTVSLYNKGIPVSTKIIGGGGKEIDKDLAYTYKISTVDARKIKETFALADDKNANKNSFYEVKDVKQPVMVINYQKDKQDYSNVYYISDDKVNVIVYNQPSTVELLYNIENKKYDYYLHVKDKDTNRYKTIAQQINDRINELKDSKTIRPEEAEYSFKDDDVDKVTDVNGKEIILTKFDETFIKPDVKEKKIEYNFDLEEK